MRKLLFAIAIGFLVASCSLAAIPDESGVFHACVATQTGLVRIIDASIESCKNHEVPRTWSMIGPIGPQGPRGPMGPAGAGFKVVDADGTVVGPVIESSRQNAENGEPFGIPVLATRVLTFVGDTPVYLDLYEGSIAIERLDFSALILSYPLPNCQGNPSIVLQGSPFGVRQPLAFKAFRIGNLLYYVDEPIRAGFGAAGASVWNGTCKTPIPLIPFPPDEIYTAHLTTAPLPFTPPFRIVR